MRAFVCATLVLCFAATASAQFAGSDALKKAAQPPAAKPEDKAADAAANPPAPPADPTATGGAAAPNALFAALDLDGDGIISKIEIGKAIRSLKKLDADNDGAITLAEVGGGGAGGAAAAGAGAIAGNQDPAKQWIERVMSKDKNGDGKLTPNELNEGERQMLANADLNRDGAIDTLELAAMGNMAQQAGNYAGAANTVAGGAGRRNGNNEAMGRFFQHDKNHDGRLTADELPPEAVGMLRGADRNGDGAIDAGEMQAAIQQMGDRAKAIGAGVDPNAAAGAGGAAERNRRRQQAGKN